MTTTTRRTTGPPSIFDRTEEQRLSDRKRLFIELEKRKEREQSLHSLELALLELDSAADDAADQHNTLAEPIQLELSSPDITAARRTKLLNELAVLNDSLERKIASVKQIRKPLAVQKQEIQALVSSAAALEGSIARSAPLADRCDAWAAQRGLQFSQQRATAAGKASRLAADELRVARAEPGRYDLIQFERRDGQWAAEVASAGRMLQAAKTEADAAQERLMVDE